jgi:hypothetical protein
MNTSANSMQKYMAANSMPLLSLTIEPLPLR